MKPTRILLVDDHALFREGIGGLIDSQDDMEVVGQASHGLEALERAQELMPDLILMDIQMPKCDGLQATRLIKTDLPYAKIVILTVHDEDKKLFEAIKAGAQGYLLKDIQSTKFLSHLRAAIDGEAAISGGMAARILEEFSRLSRQTTEAPDEETPALTYREREVLTLVAEGATNKEIGEQLHISENTVKNHMRNILGKLHLSSRHQAARYALREGLIPTTDGDTDSPRQRTANGL